MPKILVIEDEESVRENLLDLLAAEEFETIAAANGKIGLNLALSEAPDLILCDMMMPEMDGFGVLKALRQDPLTVTIPFIFLTAKSAKSDFRQGMDMGADDYLTKPFTRAELLSAIMNKLEKYANLKKYLSAQTGAQKLTPRMQLVERELQLAVKQKYFEGFEIYYQPIIDIKTNKIIGAESLIRWQNSELGPVSPAEFIPLAESNGLIIDIGHWVLTQVCEQINNWRKSGIYPLTFAVNLSAIEFNEPELINKIIHLLNFYNIEPGCLELELTERMIMQDVHTAIYTMNKLRSLGVKIAVDDFGTGYSALIYLKQFPINTLKIDRYFVQDVPNDYQKAAITTALIQMGHNLNLKLVAEGVETEAELAFLRQHNCDAMQGYLFSRPLPKLEFEKFLASNKSLPV
ncbi:response regulator receiver modulated diguanylate phosphodiesterase [Richelia sinica FACHB-800]|uniref:Response regulator receiver modulated diguanylate phosphodiesterase n=1 Tax=Richelia sinica FACHB-800 TaxID=1357546 RepID=A0A975Y6P0_9NOST|nr:EAL domain-containing response regulator [Richelia sinica]MBD2667014.1 EAL domain-containing response regulator [Richelia sinica FACHB-800]QXE25482.1 response regulator receiver modulated diguanylate phosphodiesterase [Richelia sinica FACHB-800]